MNNKPGYILFLLFSILSVCSVLISLGFSRVIIYRQLAQQSIRRQQANDLALSCVDLAQALLTVEKNKDGTKAEPSDVKDPQPKAESKESPEQKILRQIFPYFNKEKTHELTSKVDGFDADISITISSEQGKLNINSLYDFEKKKFMQEGQPNDRKKLCSWLFGRIATVHGKPSLMEPFEQHLKNRTSEFNDVTELLNIKEFGEQFEGKLFFVPTTKESAEASSPEESKKAKLFLTDIFTVCSEEETITPWLFSSSWCTLLDLQLKQKLNDEEIKKIFSKFKVESNWETDWNSCLQPFYQKEYKDIAPEIKTILTTRYEANIFSLLLRAKISETTSTIFTIVKANTKQHLNGFDLVKTYQVD